MQATGSNELESFDFLDFAQEFLRRNLKYRAQFSELTEAKPLNPVASRSVRMADYWGLDVSHFRPIIVRLPIRQSGAAAKRQRSSSCNQDAGAAIMAVPARISKDAMSSAKFRASPEGILYWKNTIADIDCS